MKKGITERLIPFFVFVVVVAAPFVLRELLYVGRTYYPDGTLAERRWEPIGLGTFKEDSGFVHTFWPNGKKHFYGNYAKVGCLDGWQTTYDSDGRILDRWHYKDCQPDNGTRITYWPNGQTRCVRTYEDGRLAHVYQAWLPDGKMEASCNIKDGMPFNGTYVKFSDNPWWDPTSFDIIPYQDGVKFGMGWSARLDEKLNVTKGVEVNYGKHNAEIVTRENGDQEGNVAGSSMVRIGTWSENGRIVTFVKSDGTWWTGTEVPKSYLDSPAAKFFKITLKQIHFVDP